MFAYSIKSMRDTAMLANFSRIAHRQFKCPWASKALDFTVIH